MEIGIFSFGDLTPHPATGKALSPQERMQELVTLGKLADDVGLDVVAMGEHHRLDMVVSSPAVVLAAIASVTKRVKLTSSTTLLNTLDPVRVYEDFATLDLLSKGRAEMIVGRGSFTESFELFGYDIKDYDALFEEKLHLLLAMREDPVVTWEGRFRPALHAAEVAPRARPDLPVWVGVGGSPDSAVRAGSLGLPMTIAILGGPERFVPFAQIHREAAARAGKPKPELAISVHGLILDDPAEAREEYAATWGGMMRKGLRNRFPPRHVPREYLDMEMGPRGAFYAGGVDEVAAKIVHHARLFDLDRVLIQFDWGGVSSEHVRRSVELLGREVAPKVRAALAK